MDCSVTCLNFLLGSGIRSGGVLIAQDQIHVDMEWEVWEEQFSHPTHKRRREKCRDGSVERCNKTWPNPECWCNDVDVAFNFKGKEG